MGEGASSRRRARSDPSRSSEALKAAIDSAVRTALDLVQPREVFGLTIGGTPSMRACTESALLRLHPGSVTTLWPDPLTREATQDLSLVRMLEADRVHQEFRKLYRNALRGGRYRAAVDIAATMEVHRLPLALVLRAWAEVGEAIANNDLVWLTPDSRKVLESAPSGTRPLEEIDDAAADKSTAKARIEVLTALVERASSDGRRGEAALHWVSVAELFPLAWTQSHRVEQVWLDRTAREARDVCRAPRSSRTKRPILRDEADGARNAAICVASRCDRCPFKPPSHDVQSPQARLWNDQGRAQVASRLRDTGTLGVVDFRNQWAHGSSESADLDEHLRKDWIDLSPLLTGGAAQGKTEVPSPACVLRQVFEYLLRNVPSNPLEIIDREADELMRARPV